jgi:protein O-mannosyl-transferase
MFKKLLFLLPFLAALVLLPAITGPLLLDDTIHLGPIQQWLSSRTGTFELIFGNKSGPFGRPVSMLSFVLNLVTTGSQIWPLKLTNLLLHLLTGLCVCKLFYRLFQRDANLLVHAKVMSIAAASIWLILPQHVATVFYVIQRMTILAALFSVIACWLYVLARERIETDQKHGLFFLFGVVVLTLLSVLSKESGLFIPLYCLLIELAYFLPSIGKPRPKLITWGFRLGVIYPCVLVAAYLAFNPSFVLAPYTDRPFSMPERAMTQISVLADYFASTFIPMVRSAGVFNDDFPIAHTMASKEYLLLLIGTGLIFAAIRLRKSMPSFSFGISLFFIGHLLESSIFSLEIYFSHRNYLPSMGLIIAAFGLIAGLLNRYPETTASIKRIIPITFVGLFLAYVAVSYYRATLWSNMNSLMTHAQIHHPTSSRMRSEILLGALYSKRLDVALQQADIAIQTAPANEKRTIQLWRILAYCYAQSPQPPAELEALFNMPADRITLATNTALEYVSAAAEVNACPGLDREKLGALSTQWAINTVQYPGSPLVWKTHHAAARLLASGGDLKAGLKQAQWAFEGSGYNFDSGLLAYQLANSLEDNKHAEEIMSHLIANKAMYSDLQQSQLRALQKQ